MEDLRACPGGGGAGRRGAVSTASSTGGFVVVHRLTRVATTGWGLQAWLMGEPAASTLQYSLWYI